MSFRLLILKISPKLSKLFRIEPFNFAQRMINVCSFVIVAFYTLLISTVLQPFDCTRQNDGSYTLTNAPSLQCFDSNWNSHLPAVIFFGILYVVSIPLFLSWLFWRLRHEIHSKKFISRYNLLVSSYKPRFFYFELVNMLKKALFVLSTGYFSSTPSVKYALGVALFMSFLLLRTILLPYQTEKANVLSNL
jgi:hypothetical protein